MPRLKQDDEASPGGHPRAPRRPALLRLAAALAVFVAASASAQPSTVYVDDSVTATESFQRLPDLLAAGNQAEALRVAQKLLDEEGDRLIVSTIDPSVFVAVRARIHAMLIADPAMLTKYRQIEGPRADKLLEDGRFEEVERSRLLTAAGFAATLRLARRELESARFDGAAIRLSQLLTHPDLSGENAALAAKLATEIASFADSKRARAAADAFAASAKLPAPVLKVVAAPPRAKLVSPPAGGESGALDLASISAEPLASAPLAEFSRPARVSGDSRILPWSIPSVAGDVIYTNDGIEVASWDRWTLAPIWRRAVGAGEADARGLFDQDTFGFEQWARGLEDVSTVTVGSGVVIAGTGYAVSNGRRSGDARIHAFEPATGAKLWTADLPMLDRQLSEATLRGPILIVGDTAVLAADKFAIGRRVAASMLVGLDCSTGKLRWIRTVANVGLPSTGHVSRPADLPFAADGVVYLTDSLGAMAAVEASSGRFVWVRRLATSVTEIRQRAYFQGDNFPWFGISVVEVGDSVVTVDPATNQLLRISKADGRLILARMVDSTEQPRSLMRVGKHIALMNPVGVSFLHTDNLAEAPLQMVPIKLGAGITGRPVVSAGKLIVPVKEGILSIDPDHAGEPVLHPLPITGHPALADGRLLIASTWSLQSFQNWESIEPKLQAAMAARTEDPAPGVAYVRIAIKAARPAGIPAAADRALDVLDLDMAEAGNQAVRRTLFELLRGAVIGVRDGSGAVIELAQLDAIIARLRRAADTPAERAEHLLIAAWAADAQSKPGAAVEALQAILQDPQLAQAIVPADGASSAASTHGWIAARDRLAAILGRVGYDAYAAFDAQADREIRDLGASPEGAEAFARRYPASRAALTALTAAADARIAQGDTPAAMDDLGAALHAARTIAAATRRPLSPEAAAAAGRLLTLLTQSGREGEAWRLLAALDLAAPGLALHDGRAPIDRAAVARSLTDALGGRDRRADIGARLKPAPQLLIGWSSVAPVFAAGPGRATDQLTMEAPALRQIGLWGRKPEDSRLGLLWTRPIDAAFLPPTFLRVDWDSTLVYWPGAAGPMVECVGVDGQTRWRTPGLDTILPPEPLDAPTFRTPQDSEVNPADVIVTLRDQTVVLVRRSGAAAAFDLSTGKPLWSRKLEISAVFDVAIAAGKLVTIGYHQDQQHPRILINDLAAGAPVRALGDDAAPLKSSPRWIRPVGDRVIVGMSDSIWGLEPATGEAAWRIESMAAVLTLESWYLADRMLVLDRDGRPWLFDPAAPAPKPIPLETNLGLTDLRRARGPRDQVATVTRGPAGSIVVATERGLNAIDGKGTLLGSDNLRVNEAPFLFAMGERLAVYLQSDAEPDRDGRRELTLWMVEMPSAKLVGEQRIAMYEAPRSLAVVDGKIVVTAISSSGNPISIVFDAPAGPNGTPNPTQDSKPESKDGAGP